MEKEGFRFSLRELLGKHYDDFIDNFMLPQIEKASSEGKIDLYTLRRLNRLLRQKGSSVFDIPASQLNYATKNTLTGGDLYRVVLPIADGITIDTFVKVFSSPKAYAGAVKAQSAAERVLKGTDSQDLVVPISYTNKELNLVAYPLVNASSLAELLPLLGEEGKEAVLKKAIDAYQQFSSELTGRKDALARDAGKSMDILLRPAQAFEEYFFSQVDSLSGQKSPADAVAAGAAKPGLEVLVKHCFAPLNTAEEQVIHPDLIPGNILVSGDIVKIIDFEKLSIGFPEFALGKLLTKADVSASLEGRLVKYAAEKRAELERKTLGEEELAASAQRYELNRIAQELFTAVRYLKRSAIASSGTLRKMADASYSLALRRIESAEKEGLIGHDFRQALENYLSASGIKFTDLGSDAARYLVPEYAVHAQASQENVALAGRINLLSGGNAAEEAKAELGEIRRGLRRSRVRGYLKKAAYAALPLLVIAGSGSGLYVSEQRARAQQQKAEALSKQSTLSGRLAILAKAGHDVGSDDLDVLAKKQLDYTSKVFKDPKTAAAFYLSPEITYAAIKDIGSTKYADLKEYLEKNHPDFYFATTYDIEGAYLVDNFARTEQESMTRQNFERLWSEAGTAYSARRGGPVSR